MGGAALSGGGVAPGGAAFGGGLYINAAQSQGLQFAATGSVFRDDRALGGAAGVATGGRVGLTPSGPAFRRDQSDDAGTMLRAASTIARRMVGSPPCQSWAKATVTWTRFPSPRTLMLWTRNLASLALIRSQAGGGSSPRRASAAPALGTVRPVPEAHPPEALAPSRTIAAAPRPRRAADGEDRSPRAGGAAPRPDPVVDRRDDDRVHPGGVVAPGPTRARLGAPGRARDRGGPAARGRRCAGP